MLTRFMIYEGIFTSVFLITKSAPLVKKGADLKILPYKIELGDLKPNLKNKNNKFWFKMQEDNLLNDPMEMDISYE